MNVVGTLKIEASPVGAGIRALAAGAFYLPLMTTVSVAIKFRPEHHF